MKSTNLIKLMTCIFIVFIHSCQSDDSTELNSTNFENLNHIRDLKSQIIYKGDIEAYEELSLLYFEGPTGELLIYSIIMANRYNYGPAYYDAFGELSNIHSYNGIESEDIDSSTKSMMNQYLINAANRGVEQASYHLNVE